MKIALFQPFDLHKWCLIGFNAFLAGLMDGHGGSGGARYSERSDFSFQDFMGLPGRAWSWLLDHPGWFAGIVFLSLVIITLVVVMTWLSSRGAFMFLDNVVHNSSDIGKPWKEFRSDGFSLFLWRLGFGIACFGFFILFLIFFFSTGAAFYTAGNVNRIPVLFIICSGLIFLLGMTLIGFIAMYLKNFVIPIMYKHRLPATRAWGRFLSLFKRQPIHFILYGLFIFVLSIAVFIAILSAGLLTCCVGFILLVIPYVGTVVTLPVLYTFRAFSLEYLAQFGAEYDLFPPIAAFSSPAGKEFR